MSASGPFGSALTRFLIKTARVLVLWAMAVGLAGGVLALGSVLLVHQARTFLTAGEAGRIARVELPPLAVRSVLRAADGSVLQYLHGEENRLPVPMDTVPQHVITAVLVAEDERYFEHGAVDLRSLTRALVSNLEAGDIIEGGSTITQQLVKTSLLNPKQDLNRKLQEVSLAVRLEGQMTKTEILERYLNTVYFGNGAYGVQAAAERYYQTDVDKLTLGQAIFLAGLIRDPQGTDPYTSPEDAQRRRDLVIERMVLLGHISGAQASELKAEALPTAVPKKDLGSTEYFTRHVVDQLLKDPKYLGGSESEREERLFTGGLVIHTTVVPGAQAMAEQSIAATLPADRGEFNAALVSVEPGSGAVRAAVSGLDFVRHKVDLVTGRGRQTGSSFKMFALMAALEAGHVPADTILGSEPCVVPDPGSAEGTWNPRNVEGQGAGSMTLTDATVQSVNCAYARLINIVRPQHLVDVARRMGIRKSELQPLLSLTLGAQDVTPLEMAAAYATLANDGEYREPYFIDRIEDRDGNVLFSQRSEPSRAVSAQHARTVIQTLTQVVDRGTGTGARMPPWQVAGKTGSTDLNQDAWFVGVTPKLATAVWMGSPAGKVSMYNVGGVPRVYGGTYPAMIFRSFMSQFLAVQQPVGFPPPEQDPNHRAPRFLSEGEPAAK